LHRVKDFQFETTSGAKWQASLDKCLVAARRCGSGLDDFEVCSKLVAGQMANPAVQRDQLAVVVDGETQQVAVGDLALSR
jgi:hypothetical protein